MHSKRKQLHESVCQVNDRICKQCITISQHHAIGSICAHMHTTSDCYSGIIVNVSFCMFTSIYCSGNNDLEHLYVFAGNQMVGATADSQ